MSRNFHHPIMTASCFLAIGLTCVLGLDVRGAERAGTPRSQGVRESDRAGEPAFPPALPGGRLVASDQTGEFLKAPPSLRSGVEIAKTPPRIDFMYYPGQDYPGKPWSAWGDSLAANGNYYASIGDHLAPRGHAFVFEYDPERKALHRIVDVTEFLHLPEGHYAPGKIHGRLDLGKDGWLYFATHRGSTRVTSDAYHYRGDWILRHHPGTGETEVVVRAPVPKHCIPASVLDPERLIFYGGTAAGSDAEAQGIQFFAYDIRRRKMLYSGPNGPARYMILAKSTGRVYYTRGAREEGPLMRFDPSAGEPPSEIEGTIGIRAASEETRDGFVYAVSQGQGGREALLYSLNTTTEEISELCPAAVGTQTYITSLDADPTGRFLYYVPGAHGGSEQDGSPIVQFDVRTKQQKVIAFLHPFFAERYGCALKGTFSSAVDPKGDTLYITWNNSRAGRVWDSCVLTVVHIPETERTR